MHASRITLMDTQKKKHNKAGLGAGLNYALTNTMNKHSTKVACLSVQINYRKTYD